MSKLVENIIAARASGVPLLDIETRDQPETVEQICSALNGAPKITWDCLNGLRALNDSGVAALGALGDLRPSARCAEALKLLERLPAKSLVFFYNAHRHVEEATVAQGIANLREPFKGNGRTLLLLGPSFADMRPELQADVVTLREPLPNDAQIKQVITDLHDGQGPLDEAKLPRMMEAVRGLPALFTVEQAVAMSFRKGAVDMDTLWERKMEAINSTKGLKIYRHGLRYSDLAGMDRIQAFVRSIPFSVVLHLDEIEKMTAGSSGDQADSSGVAQDQLNVLLKKMEKLRWKGMILFGVPGSGKTAFSEATAGEAGRVRIEMDFGAFKGRYVGDSEAAIREGFDIAEGLGGSDVLVLATANRMKTLPPELRRRFTLGNWFFDVPSLVEQKPIKAIYERKLGLTQKANGDWPDTSGWTGAEIRNCAELAVLRRTTLAEAAEFVVPISIADPESVEDMRNLADGRFLSVSYPGRWTRNRPEITKVGSKRSIA